MAVEIKNFVNIKLKIKDNLEKKHQNFRLAVSDLQTKIVIDTEAGKDIFGNTFEKKYSEPYRKWREKKGYRTDPPNLRVTGTMMRSLNTRFEVLGDSIRAIMGFSDSSEKVKGNLKYRKFFGLTAESIKEIKKRLKEK